MAVKVDWFGGYGGPGVPLPPLREARVVARSRTTTTESGLLDLPGGPVPVHRKTYRYEGMGALLSGAFRTTFAARSRPRREAEALVRLGALAPPPVALMEDRVAGFLRAAVLLVRTVEGGVNLDESPPSPALAAAVGRAAGTMHAAGFGDLSLAPRNLVVATRGIFKVDSGRMRTVPRGGAAQAADLADLLAGLEARWTASDLDGLRAAYAAAAGGLPAGIEGAVAAARLRARRRDPR
jgi:tRNA A-37 threonylcarbamoyl transferase component Bud32